jgi:hypothetical protein
MEKFKGQNVSEVFKIVDFTKASPQAINAILSALNAEVDQAVIQNRFPSLEGAFGRLSPSTGLAQ